MKALIEEILDILRSTRLELFHNVSLMYNSVLIKNEYITQFISILPNKFTT